jgi:hypothetical protein
MAYRTQLARILLGKNPELLPSPLFKSQAEIAKLIVDSPGSVYDDVIILRSFLNQVLLGKRRCNQKLTDCLVAEASKKLESPKQRDRVKKIILQAIETQNDEVQRYQARYPGEVTRQEVFDRMSTIQEDAESVFIINTKPLELVPKSINPKQQALTKNTIRAMLAGKRHIFCVPDKPTAILLWRAFYQEILEDDAVGEDDADKKLAKLEHDRILTVYKIDPRLCVHSTVVYNADFPEKASGWIWYVPYDSNQVVEIPKQVLENWTREYFNPISTQQLEGQERISWKEAKPAIR